MPFVEDNGFMTDWVQPHKIRQTMMAGRASSKPEFNTWLARADEKPAGPCCRIDWRNSCGHGPPTGGKSHAERIG